MCGSINMAGWGKILCLFLSVQAKNCTLIETNWLNTYEEQNNDGLSLNTIMALVGLHILLEIYVVHLTGYTLWKLRA